MIRFLIIWLCAVLTASAWNLATYDDAGLHFITTNNDYQIVHVSVFYVRAFLTIRNRRNSSDHQITIIESTWPENLLPIQSRVFPNDLSHAKTHSNCNGIVKTIQTAVDRTNGLLWLLDNGSIYCPPKLIVFDLLRGNYEVHRNVFNKLKSGSLKSIQLYVKESSEVRDENVQRTARASTYALIMLRRAKYLIQYSLVENLPRKLTLLVPGSNGKFDVIIPAEMTIRNDIDLVVSDYSNGLWIAKLDNIKYSVWNRDIELFVEMKYLGALLGTSRALAIPSIIEGDASQYLYYYIPRDGAVVRWNFRYPLRAEGHEVLYLAKSPIVQIWFGAKGSVWIIYEHGDEFGDHCQRISNSITARLI